MKKKRVFSSALAIGVLVTALTGCKDSTQTSVTVSTDYDPAVEVAKYKDVLGEIPAADKDFVVEMGYNNCDHMVAALVGQGAGIYDALGLKVNITKTGKIAEAMSSGEMDVGYLGIDSAIDASKNGAPLYMAAANHLGGSRYLVVSNDITDPEQLKGQKLAIGGESVKYRPEWHTWAEELGLSPDPADGEYEAISKRSSDALIAMKAGQLAAFTC